MPQGGDRDDRRGGPMALLAIVLAPIAAMLIQLAVSRSREYGADASGAKLVGDPRPLADALRKLGSPQAQAIPLEGATPTNAHLCIVSPLSAGGLAGLFSTHPPLEERIRRLLEMRA